MNRWVWFSLCAMLGLALVICGLLMPIHLRAVDVSVIQRAGRNSPSLIEKGTALAGEKNLGAAQLLLQAAQAQGVPGAEKLGFDVGRLANEHPGFRVWGGGEAHLEVLFGATPKQANPAPEPLTEFMIRQTNRSKALSLLEHSTNPAVQELLRCRNLTNTTLIYSSQSSAGQAFDAAIAISGLLLEERCFNPALSNSVTALASQANRGAS